MTLRSAIGIAGAVHNGDDANLAAALVNLVHDDVRTFEQLVRTRISSDRPIRVSSGPVSLSTFSNMRLIKPAAAAGSSFATQEKMLWRSSRASSSNTTLIHQGD
jgi:hypothetical protein